MQITEYGQKITATHLKRKAALYIRQSTMKQVYENSESTIRQYALKEKLIKLGWLSENIIVIDCDLGRSGGELSERDGFKKLVADVGSGEVGVVACLECSRLARNSQDWGRLMEICAITQTVLLDIDGIYNPSDFNDRMLLGLKGTMSEAELHFIRARMRGGALNKAKRGEFRISLPIGYVYNEAGYVVKDPNLEIQSAVELFFESFRICGSANKMLSYYLKMGYKIPTNYARGFDNKEVSWVNLSSTRVLDMLHNPTYAGIYAYGQTQIIPTINGKKRRFKPIEQWHACISNHHEGYITEDEFKHNQAKLFANDTNKSPIPPVREGRALLQGICICGVCGQAMTVSYRDESRGNVPYYRCDGKLKHYGGEICQHVHGVAIDKAISGLILERLTPIAISNAIEVQREVERRKNTSDNYFILKVERAQYEASLARKRYMNVDSENRLVAFELEKIWNQKINELARAEEELRTHEKSKEGAIADANISELMSIAENVKDIWHRNDVFFQDKKRIIRCLVENVTIIKKGDIIQLGVCFKGGTTTQLECKNPPLSYTTWTTSNEVIDIIRKEAEFHTADEIAQILAKAGYHSGKGSEFTSSIVQWLMHSYNITSLQQHLKMKGFLTVEEKAAQLNISAQTLHKMKNSALLGCEFIRTNGKGYYMFAP